MMPTKPAEGLRIPVQLPGELSRGEVLEVRGDDEIVVGLTVQTPMNLSRTHTYRLGDKVVCRRRYGMGGLEQWEAVSTA